MRRRIAFISTMEGVPWGGSERLWSQAAHRLRTLGHDVGVCVRAWPEPVPAVQPLALAGCRIHLRRPPSRWEGWQRRLCCDRSNPDYAWLQRFQPDLAVISDGGAWGGAAWAHECARQAIPYVCITQAVSEAWWPDDPTAITLRNAFAHARCCYFVSEANRRLVETMLAVPMTNAALVRNPFQVDYHTAPHWPVPSHRIAATPCLRLACVARLEPHAKGQDLLLALLDRPQWRRRPLEVCLVGDGRSREGIRSLLTRMDLPNVTLMGHVANIQTLWQEFHALILPSRFEGLPLALVEAMLCHRPCIVTNVAGNPELLEDNVTGFLAAAPTVDALDEALERSWRRHDEWQEIGRLAGVAVRGQIPPDPVGAFVDHLTRFL